MNLMQLDDEPLALVVRRGHPLLMRAAVAIGDLQDFDWVMPEEESLLSQTVMRWLSNAGYPPPRRWISTSSFLFTLAVLKETDALAPLARPVVESFAEGMSMPFVQVPLEMEIAVEAFGILSRRDAALPPAAERLAAMIVARSGRSGR